MRNRKYLEINHITWMKRKSWDTWNLDLIGMSCALHNCVAKLFSASLRYASITSYASLLIGMEGNRGLYERTVVSQRFHFDPT
jgi:hypothetical protein